MKWITTIDLIHWSDTISSQGTLPQLLRKLIRVTCDFNTIRFPSGENILLGGWDGILDSTSKTEYVPLGSSVWEFGTNKDVKKKANEDYEKRSKNPLGINPADTTFVFVTSRRWADKDDWIAEKKKDKLWNDIHVIDVQTLEEWLEVTPTVATWLAMFQLEKVPSGVQSTEDFWNEWSHGTKFHLIPDLIMAGRNDAKEQLLHLWGSSSLVAVQGASADEALAFIISTFKTTPDTEEDFFARSIIVKSVQEFRELSAKNRPLILIPKFEDDDGLINTAIGKGHTVIVPLGANNVAKWSNKVSLPLIDRESFIAALIKMGITKEFSEKYSKESGRSIPILRRQLEINRAEPEWTKALNVRDIIPALLVGRWDENYEEDKNIIAKIAGESYEDYIKKLHKWLLIGDSPIIKIGASWRLSSPIDAWTLIGSHLTDRDFELLLHSLLNELRQLDPSLEMEEGTKYMAGLYGKVRKSSRWIREGLLQSVIILSTYGDILSLNLSNDAVLGIDRAIRELLNTNDSSHWKSFEGELPLIAEASPNSFLKGLEDYLNLPNSSINDLFREEEGFLSPITYHTGLLWALEGLAWIPEYLSRAALILVKLATVDPGGNLVNRPINSLTEIFRSWHPQTLATIEQRVDVLRLISKKQPHIAWSLLVKLIPGHHSVAHFTHKMRWRMFNESAEIYISPQEIENFHSEIVDLLITVFDFSETNASTLLKVSTQLYEKDRNKILSFLETNFEKIPNEKYLVSDTAREILARHRSYPYTEWALGEEVLKSYDIIFEKYKPSDSINRSIWLFNSRFPNLVEGIIRKETSEEERQKRVLEERIKGLKEIYSEFGLEKTKELSLITTEPGILGDTLAYFIDKEDEILELCQLLKNEGPSLDFIHGFLYRKYWLNGIDWIFDLYEKLVKEKFSFSDLANIFIPLPQKKNLWDFIESHGDLSDKYWMEMLPNFWGLSQEEKIYGLKKLHEIRRYFSTLLICSHFPEEVPSDIIIEILDKVINGDSSEKFNFQGYEVDRLFEVLEKRSDVDKAIFIKLEWWYMPLLNSFNRDPKNLHEQLSISPEFFMEVLKWTYKPDTDELAEIEREDKSDDHIIERARQSYELLSSWKKIPGTNDSGNIDLSALNNWIKEVRERAKACGRSEVTDGQIGKILAQYPEEDENWPPDEICDIIESINTDNLKTNFSIAIHNKRSSFSKSYFEGGNREKELSEYFKKLATSKINTFPIVASILDELARGYDADAKREDESAKKRSLEI